MVIATTELDLCDCGALVPKIDGPTHAYFGNNAGCWQLFGEVLARDYADYQHGALHNLAVDTYAVQHPRNADRRNRQSVGVHLISLRALLERNLDAAKARTLIADIAFAQRRHRWEWPHLVPPTLGATTVVEVHSATTPEEHREQIHRWAHGVWQASAEHHTLVRQWLDAAWQDSRVN